VRKALGKQVKTVELDINVTRCGHFSEHGRGWGDPWVLSSRGLAPRAQGLGAGARL